MTELYKSKQFKDKLMIKSQRSSKTSLYPWKIRNAEEKHTPASIGQVELH